MGKTHGMYMFLATPAGPIVSISRRRSERSTSTARAWTRCPWRRAIILRIDSMSERTETVPTAAAIGRMRVRARGE